MELKSLLNNFKASSLYTKVIDLRVDIPYKILKLERTKTTYRETVMVTLEGQEDDDCNLRVYLPKRFNETVTDRNIIRYNYGAEERIHLVKRTAQAGSSFTPLEFV